MPKFETSICNLESICPNQYLIPTYQRPYVWRKEQLDKFILDFWCSYLLDETEYFVGNVITSRQNGIFELIDGQQRFTTLWLIAFSFYIENDATPLKAFLKNGDNLRLGFAIRTQVEEYLKLLLEHKTVFTEKFSEKRIKEDEYLIYIAEAVTTIQNMLKQLPYTNEKNKDRFGEFIFRNVLFVINTSPPKSNLNKLFITLNNSGIQLEQTDILKANLIKNIQTDKFVYSKMWEACEKMDDFFPYNVKALFNDADWKSINLDSLAVFNRNQLLKYPNDSDDIGNKTTDYKLDEIVNGEVNIENIKINVPTGSSPGKCKSIITFAQLLLHTFRIYLKNSQMKDFAHPFHVKNLLQIFDNFNNENEIKKFIELLWRIRFLFDRYVVKWTSNEEDDDILSLTSVYFDGGQLKWDEREKSELSILQSVLYHTSNPNTQIWLTPYLFFLSEGISSPIETLENIDNTLSISLLEDKETTFLQLDKDYHSDITLNFNDYLKSYQGTSFRHYWFQKVEYILWKTWDRTDRKFANYRITRKNSVEHVFPQNHEFNKKLDNNQEIHLNWLNSFGNLGLINVSQNSSYSNQDVKKKKIDFDNKPTYDSLKLAKIYNSPTLPNWGISEIINHQNEMIELLIKHYHSHN